MYLEVHYIFILSLFLLHLIQFPVVLFIMCQSSISYFSFSLLLFTHLQATSPVMSFYSSCSLIFFSYLPSLSSSPSSFPVYFFTTSQYISVSLFLLLLFLLPCFSFSFNFSFFDPFLYLHPLLLDSILCTSHRISFIFPLPPLYFSFLTIYPFLFLSHLPFSSSSTTS